MDGVSQLAFWEILESFYEFAIATGLLEEIQGSPGSTLVGVARRGVGMAILRKVWVSNPTDEGMGGKFYSMGEIAFWEILESCYEFAMTTELRRDTRESR